MNLSRLYKASFKGIRFQVTGEIITEGGRKIAEHEYPKGDKRFIEDLGLLEKSFTMTGTIHGAKYKTDKQALIKVLDDEAVGVLIHPFLGSLNVKALPYKITEDITTLGKCKFDLVFKVSSLNPIQPYGGSSNSLFSLTTKLIANIQSYLSDSWVVSFAENVSRGADLLNDVGDAMGAISNELGNATDGVNEYNRAVANFKSNINSFVNSAEELSSATTAMFQLLGGVNLSSKASATLFSGLFGFKGAYSAPASTTARREALNNQKAIETMQNINALSYAYSFASITDYLNDVELRTAYEQLENQYRYIEDLEIDDDILNQLQDLRNNWRLVAEQKEITTQKVIEVEVYEQPLDVLCYMLYGSLDNFDILVSLNDIVNPSAVSGFIKVLTI